jgi:hypothetical protein
MLDVIKKNTNLKLEIFPSTKEQVERLKKENWLRKKRQRL